MTFPIKERINTLIERLAALYKVGGWIKSENVVMVRQLWVPVDPQIEYTVRPRCGNERPGMILSRNEFNRTLKEIELSAYYDSWIQQSFFVSDIY